MSINTKKVVTGGLAAGVVIILLNILAQIVFGSRMQHEMNAWMSGSAEHKSASISTLVAGITMKFIIGLILMWYYAAMQLQFKQRFRTAVYAATSVWILGAIFFSDWLLLGIMSFTLYAIVEVLQLLSFFIAVLVGARIYEG
jgi:hypothetical protein